VVLLKLRPLSIYGKKVTGILKADEPALNSACSCPPSESCSVEITELPGRRFEVVVKRPRPVTEAHGWTPITAITGMYRLLFDRRVSAQLIHEAVARMVSAAIEKEPDASSSQNAPATPSQLESLNIVVVDSITLTKARGLIVGCRGCSRLADIPFNSILDVITGGDSATRYFLAEGSAACPRCGRNLGEDSMVEYEPRFEESDH
jgi:hypothetical protein